MKKFIKRPGVSWILMGIAAALLVFFMMKLPSGLVPQEDQGMFMVEVDAPEGYTLEQTYDLLQQVEKKVKVIPEMESYAMVSGYGLISGQGSSYGFMVIRLKNWEERSGIEHYIDMVMYRFYMSCADIKNATVIPFQMPQIPGYGTSSNVNLVVEDPTDGDLSEFSKKTDQFLAKLMERKEVSMAMSTYSEKFPKFRVEVDPTQCSRSGLSAKEVLSTLGNYCSGSYVANYNQFGKVYQLWTAAAPEYRLDPTSLNNIFVKTSSGKMAPLSEFVSLKEIVGPSNNQHFNLFSSIECQVSPASGYSEGQVQEVIKEVFRETMPSTATFEYSSMSRETAEAAGSNTTTLIYCICIVLIYLIMGSLYNSWFTPLAVLLSIPFGLMGAFAVVWLCANIGFPGMENNVYVQTGVVMLIGLLAKTAILITEVASEHRKHGMGISEAAFLACQERLRPILMTVICMVVGMIPLAIASGAGANGNRALAMCVIGGMVVGTIALLFVVPAFYIIFQKLHDKFQGSIVEVQEVNEVKES